MSEGNGIENYFNNLAKDKKEEDVKLGKTVKNEDMENRFFTPDEWFEKFYQGHNDEQLPENVFKDVSPEVISDLREKYASRVSADKRPQEKDGDLFDQKI